MNIDDLAEKYVKANYPDVIGDDFQAIKEAYINGFNAARYIYIPVHHTNNCIFINNNDLKILKLL